MRRRSSGLRQADEPEVNLTPLIDIVFVILIVFIVIAPLLQVEQVQLAAALSSSQSVHSAQASSMISVYVKQDNTVWLGEERMEEADFLPRLVRARQEQPQAIPQLVQDRRSHFGTYQQVKNAMERAGFSELELVLQPE